jgi:hypothetical protein
LLNTPEPVGDGAHKALALLFGEGQRDIHDHNGRIFTAALDFGGGAGMELFGTIDQSSGISPEVLGITGTGWEGTPMAKWVRAMSHPVSRVNTGGSAVSLRAVAGCIAGTGANLCEAFSCP